MPPAGGPGRGGARLRRGRGHGAAAAAGPEGLGARADVQPQIPALPLSGKHRQLGLPVGPDGASWLRIGGGGEPVTSPMTSLATRLDPCKAAGWGLLDPKAWCTQTSLVHFVGHFVVGVSFSRTGSFPYPGRPENEGRLRCTRWISGNEYVKLVIGQAATHTGPPAALHNLWLKRYIVAEPHCVRERELLPTSTCLHPAT